MANQQERLELASQIRESVGRTREEPGLFPEELNERTIAHRFAIHLENILDENGWLEDYPHVDIEYNRIGEFDDSEPKRFEDDLEDLFSNLAGLTRNDLSEPLEQRIGEILEKLQNRLIYPDIVVHERGVSQNLIVFEIKKGTSSTNTRADDFDYSKLAAYTDPDNPNLGYRFGVFLKLKVGSESEDIEDLILNSAWFEGGEAIEENSLVI